MEFPSELSRAFCLKSPVSSLVRTLLRTEECELVLAGSKQTETEHTKKEGMKEKIALLLFSTLLLGMKY